MDYNYHLGYGNGYRDGMATERKISDMVTNRYQKTISERDATIKGLQQSLDEATARIDSLTTPGPPPFKVGDAVSNGMMGFAFIIQDMGRVSDGWSIQSKGSGKWYHATRDAKGPFKLDS